MNPDDFSTIARLLKDRTGLLLTKDKGYLVQNRLAPVVRERGWSGMTELVAALRGGDAAITSDVIDAMMSRETGFFRDWKPFKHLAKVVLPNLRVARLPKRQLRILCAGCSTGQEAYSIAMQILEDAAAFSGWQMEIIGIDISASAIASAERGVYSQFDVQRGLPIRRLLRHFAKQNDAWRIKDDVRRLVSFRTWNLLDDLFPLGRFDVILCRNVLIAFDQQTKLEILQKFGRVLVDDGVLYVGIHEGVTGVSESFRSVLPNLGIYSAFREGAAATRSMSIAHAR
jgi:chemotaxis protein methyltransferase CheR